MTDNNLVLERLPVRFFEKQYENNTAEHVSVLGFGGRGVRLVPSTILQYRVPTRDQNVAKSVTIVEVPKREKKSAKEKVRKRNYLPPA